MKKQLAAAGALAGAFALFTWLERKRPLRVRREPAPPRVAKNLGIAVLSLVAHRPVKARKRIRVDEVVADVLLLDYTLWWWHRWNHEVPALWYFHALHHRDPDLDTSTALRFHPGEQLLASIFRRLQVRLIRPSEFSLQLWQTLLFASILFHHSNLRLESDSKLAQWIATPRMHGIHHSNRREDEHSNYASLLSWWDTVHGTLRLDVPQETITIGQPI
jgi:sterol desaturase/sphingolipid hydroxylase (fatty acid hydroxylase superfamily)